MPATPTITPTRVFVLKGSAAAKSVSVSVADFILRLGSDICCLTCRKNIKIGQQLPNLQQTHTILTRSFTCRICADCIYKVVQQHNLGDVANSIPRLCIETS